MRILKGEKALLKKQNDMQLKRLGVTDKVIPFYQIWQELVNEKTLDIYQYRILTSFSALEELAEVLRKTIAGVFTNDANVESCREETLYILNSDIVVEKHYKASKIYISKLYYYPFISKRSFQFSGYPIVLISTDSYFSNSISTLSTNKFQ